MAALALWRPAPLAAQDASPIDDLIARVRAAVNDLNYPEALRRGREVYGFARDARADQMVALHQAMAAAFYPEESAAQRPDSALYYLRQAVRLAPDVTLHPDLKWNGLDSLLATARRTTFAVRVRPNATDTLVGPTGKSTLSLVASRPAKYRLRVRALPGGASVQHDSLMTATDRGTLSFRAMDGRTVLLSPGEYEFIVIAYDTASTDSLVIRHNARVTGEALALVPRPMLDTTKLKPEYVQPRRRGMVATAIVFATTTFVIASVARADEPIRSAYGTDGRATLTGVAILGAAAAGFWLDKGRDDPAALRANLDARIAHRKAVQDAEAENKRRLDAYRTMVQIQPEALQ